MTGICFGICEREKNRERYDRIPEIGGNVLEDETEISRV